MAAEKKQKYIVTHPGLAKPRIEGKNGQRSRSGGEYDVGETVSLTEAQAAAAVNKVRPADKATAEKAAKGPTAAELKAATDRAEAAEKALEEAQKANEALAAQLAEAQTKLAAGE